MLDPRIVAMRAAALAPEFFRLRNGVDHATSHAMLSASIASIPPERRDDLLRRAVNREHVQLELDVLAYEQRRGERNRNCVRFSDGTIMPLGTSGKGTPFLRDHNQHDSLSRLGTVIASRTTERGTAAEIRQTVQLVEPAAVERALRGLLGPVSIGWRPNGPVNCTACNAPIFTKSECKREMHLPGDVLEGVDDGPTLTVEWEYTEAELVETSEVTIAAVPEARVESVRESLAASLGVRLLSEGIRRADAKRRPSGDLFEIGGAWEASARAKARAHASAPSNQPMTDAAMWKRLRGGR